MIDERSPDRNKPLANFADSPTQSEQETELIESSQTQSEQETELIESSQTQSEQETELIESSQINDQANDNHQINLLHQPVWFWQQHSRWSFFVRGLFWGGIIASTAIVSAGGGVALTKITAVEQTIIQTIKPSS
ncbi:MAG: hypothetical protein ACRDBG_20735, partial [Waterburya sp.]